MHDRIRYDAPNKFARIMMNENLNLVGQIVNCTSNFRVKYSQSGGRKIGWGIIFIHALSCWIINQMPFIH